MKKSIPTIILLLSLSLMLMVVSLTCGRSNGSPSAEINFFNFFSQKQFLKMAYTYKKSKSGTGETVLFLHGKNFSGEYWKEVMDRLLENGFNVIAPDQIGFGRSAQPTNYQYSFEQLALNTKKLLDTLGISSVHVVGHSMGGMLAIRFALMYPNKCKQLFLENPIGLEDTRTIIPYTGPDAEFKIELKKTKETIKKYMRENYFHNEWKDDYNVLLDQNTSYLTEKNFGDYAWNKALTTEMIYTQPVYQDLEKIEVPTVLLIGQADRTSFGKEKVKDEEAENLGNYQLIGKRANQLIKNSKLIEFEGVGHIPHVEALEKFTDVLLGQMKKKVSRNPILSGLR
jgi:pimeloyl-ACP methyl ester carboxylesterase